MRATGCCRARRHRTMPRSPRWNASASCWHCRARQGDHVRAHLSIARAYLGIAMKEREAALALIDRHGLGDAFAAELDELRSTFNRELTREQKLAAAWREATADLINAQRCKAVLAQLMKSGSLSKSGYAELCALSPATASKHLVTLAERGLLVQTGKGPATRYVLPA
ncbi:hypothetical protein FSC37_15145 [Piscinibacter aquaticus]|uniref:Uncharacterized protein n=1 Tax=Piscinibacter aquaticus TaxID=392597 RepID=A0A5C6U4G6_9BURK|nr:hypothetical protein FSC37_15145 [Piscinibacter aquaticus]